MIPRSDDIRAVVENADIDVLAYALGDFCFHCIAPAHKPRWAGDPHAVDRRGLIVAVGNMQWLCRSCHYRGTRYELEDAVLRDPRALDRLYGAL